MEKEEEEEVNNVPSSELPLAYGNSARAAEGKTFSAKDLFDIHLFKPATVHIGKLKYNCH